MDRTLEQERSQIRSLRESNNALLESRTELELLLRQCLDDVKLEVAKRHAAKHQSARRVAFLLGLFRFRLSWGGAFSGTSTLLSSVLLQQKFKKFLWWRRTTHKSYFWTRTWR